MATVSAAAAMDPGRRADHNEDDHADVQSRRALGAAGAACGAGWMAQCHLGATVRRARPLAAETMTTGPARGTSAARTVSTASERELLEAARRGDDDAFGRLAGPFRGELYAHCYRMLGSAADAEDALQETLLRAWRALPRFEGRSSVRSWLYKIATNACLRAIERRPRRVLPADYGPAADPHDGPAEPVTEAVWLDPYPDARLGLASGPASPEARYEQREGVELAFLAALQHLPARQRAVLILRDVLGFSARETATVLETTPVSVDSALQRAHKTVDQRLPDQSQQATLRSLGDGALRRVVQRYVTAWERNDVDAVVAMLAEDARLAMPPLPTWFRGRDQVASFLRGGPLAGATRWRLIPVRANAQLAFGLYAWDDKAQTFGPRAVDVLTLRGAQIREITAFLTPDAFRNFDLPASLPASGTNP
jgi:RNA polymerase sigma-70 factor, ECF subfamily